MTPDLTVAILPEKKCLICQRVAHCNNYGAQSCDACKMFFRRVVLLNLQYFCDNNNRCFDNYIIGEMLPKCKSCRYRRCLLSGMTTDKMHRIKTCKLEVTATLIRDLLYRNKQRANALMTTFSFGNPSLDDVIANHGTPGLVPSCSTHLKDEQEWRFMDMCTVIDFFLGLPFMHELDHTDKYVLIQNFTARAVLFFSSHRAMKAGNDKMLTPSGQETVSDIFQTTLGFSFDFICPIRSLLVGKLIELGINDDEFLLLAVLFFCNIASCSLSEHGQEVVSRNQKTYCSALWEYCTVSYQKDAPTRFTDLISVCHVINKNFEEVQKLTVLVKLKMPHSECKKIFDDIIDPK